MGNTITWYLVMWRGNINSARGYNLDRHFMIVIGQLSVRFYTTLCNGFHFHCITGRIEFESHNFDLKLKGSRVRSHLFESKNWFEGCAIRWLYIEIYTFNRSRGLRSALSMIVPNLNTKSTTYTSFEPFFFSSGPCYVSTHASEAFIWSPRS
jgi:hypothetical protein